MLVVSGKAGAKNGKVSNKYDLIVTPFGPFFAIWGIIYIGLIISGVYCLVSNTWSLGVTVLFAAVNILNALWVYVFSFATLTTNNICLFIVILMTLLNQVQWVWMEIPANSFEDISTWNITNRNIFAFYQGWLIAASNLNLGVTLVHSLGVSKNTHAFIFWIMCPLCIIGMVIFNLTLTEGFVNNIAMYFSAIYALFGAFISTKRKYGKDEHVLLSSYK